MLNDINISACMPLRVSNPCSRKFWEQDDPINGVTGPERRVYCGGLLCEIIALARYKSFYWMIARKSSQAARWLAAALEALGRSRAVPPMEILLVESLVGCVGALGAIELICTIANDDLQQARKGKESCSVRKSLGKETIFQSS